MNTRVVTFGEIMLRLKSPGATRLLQTDTLEATFGGAEANVASSLALFGVDTSFVTALPNNPIGDACIQFLKGKGVDTRFIHRGGNRMGIYYLEAGANQRPLNVIYDRSNSSIAADAKDVFDWKQIFEGANWFHITGITPAISESAAELSLTAVEVAQEMGLTVSCDYNYRSKLWNYGKSAPEVMRQLVNYVDIGIGNVENCQRALGISLDNDDWETDGLHSSLHVDDYESLAEKMFTNFPNLKVQALTMRQIFDANHHKWSACLYNGSDFMVGKRYDIPNIVDRVGSGDAFAAGLIYGLSTGMEEKDTLEFAIAAACLKHSISGDMNLVSVDEVIRLVREDKTGWKLG